MLRLPRPRKRRGTALSPRIERLESRRVLATVVWDGIADGDGDGTSWNDSKNWAGDTLPTAADDVIVSASATVRVNVGVFVHSLDINANLLIDSGLQIAVTGNASSGISTIRGVLSAGNDATFTAIGSGTVFQVDSTAGFTGVNLRAASGGTLNLNVPTYSGSSTSAVTKVVADGGTINITLGQTNGFAGNTASGAALQLEATNSGLIKIGGATFDQTVGDVKLLADSGQIDIAADRLTATSGGVSTLTALNTGVVKFSASAGSRSVLDGYEVNLQSNAVLSGPVSFASGSVIHGDSARIADGLIIPDVAGTAIDPGTTTVGTTGKLDWESDLFLGSNTTIFADVAGTTPGTQHDQIRVFGTVDLAGALLSVNRGAFDPAEGDRFLIIDNDGSSDAVVGTFSLGATAINEGDTFDVAGRRFRVTYRGGDGNDVELYFTNSAPIAGNFALPAGVAEDSTAGVLFDKATLVASGSDPDGDPLTFAGFTQGSRGTVTDEGSQLRYVPNKDEFGSESFTYLLSDGNGHTGSGTITFTVTPNDDPPTLDPISNIAVDRAGTFSILLTGLSAGPANELQTPTVTVTSASDTAFSIPTPTYDARSSTLTFTAPATFPVATVITVNVDVSDGTTTISRSFLISIPGPDAGGTLETAQPVDVGGTFAGSTPGNPSTLDVVAVVDTPRDADYYVFTATRTGLLEVRMAAVHVNSFLVAFDQDRRLLAYDDNAAGGANALLRFTVEEGRQYFLRAGAIGASTGGYELALTFIVDEIGDGFAEARDITGLFTTGGDALVFAPGLDPFSTTIDSPGDVDFVRFVAVATGRMTVTQTVPFDVSGLDSVLTVFDSSTTFLTGNDDVDGSLRSRVTFNVVAGRTYYVRVTGFDGTFGDWALQFETEVNPADEVGDIPADAAPLPLAANAAGGQSGVFDSDLNSGDDVDFVRFAATVTGQAVVRITTSLPLVVDVLDGPTRIAHDRSSADGLSAAFDVVAGHVYFLRIAAAEPGAAPPGGISGQYSLQIDTRPGALTPQPGIVLSPAEKQFLYTALVAGFIEQYTLAERPLALIARGVNEFIVQTFIARQGGLGAFTVPTILIWVDPVDFVQTDADGRQAGFHKPEAGINEYGPHTYYSGDGALELLVIPNATGGSFGVTFYGVGSGSFLAGVNLITGFNVQSVTLGGSLFKGSTSIVLNAGGPSPFDSSLAASFSESSLVGILGGRVLAISGLVSAVYFTSLNGTGSLLSGLSGRVDAANAEFARAVRGLDAALIRWTARATSAFRGLPQPVRSLVYTLLGRTFRPLALPETLGERLLEAPQLSFQVMEDLLSELFRPQRPAEPRAPQPPPAPAPPAEASSREIPAEPPPVATAPESDIPELPPEVPVTPQQVAEVPE